MSDPTAPNSSDSSTDDAATDATSATGATGATEPLVSSASPRPRTPRIRSGAIVWGLLVSAAAVFLLAIVTSPANAAAFSAWTGSLGWGGVVLVAVIAIGAFILIMALLSVIRGAQRRRSTP